MIERIIWHPNQLPIELESPFLRGDHERPIRISFHSASFTNLTNEEELAIKTLRNLAILSELDVMEFQEGSYSYTTVDEKIQAFKSCSGDVGQIQISPYNPDHDSMPIYSGNSKYFRETYMYSGQLLELASYLAKHNNTEDPQFQSILKDLIVARANCDLYRDLLVTNSTYLLNHQDVAFVREVNLRTPLETARIVGQFLRSRNLFTYQTTSKNGRIGVTRGTFYWALVDLKMPHIWQYQNKCKLAGILRIKGSNPEDDTAMTAHSAISRCIRALQAVDAIAIDFYKPLEDEIRSDMLYHFYYLALLLSGVLDVQALIAYRAYNVSKNPERAASFGNPDFIKKLKAQGAIDIASLFDKSSATYHVITILREIRNTIHRAEFPTIDIPGIKIKEVQASGAFVKVDLPHENMKKLLTAIKRCGTADKWGLIEKTDGLLLEPFSFSTTLTEECFSLIDKIAELTDLNNLFPKKNNIPTSPIAPPRDEQWNGARSIISVLG